MIVPNDNVFRYHLNYITSISISNFDILKRIVLEEMNKLVSLGVSEENKRMGAYYILTALTEVSPECATSIPWLVQNSF